VLPRHAHTAPNSTSNITTSPAHVTTASNGATVSSMPLPPAQGTKPPPTSPNDRIMPTKATPMLPKPTALLSTGDVVCTTAQIAANGEIQEVRKPGKWDMREVHTMTNTTGDEEMCLAPSSFDWAEDVDVTVTPTPIALITPAARTSRNFSALRSSTWNPWGSLSRCHHRSQLRICNSFHSCKYNTNYAYKPATPSPVPAPVQLVETV
jgi:hypothetical protein